MFPKSICPKINAGLEFELVYYDSALQNQLYLVEWN